MVAGTNTYFTASSWRINYFNTRLCFSAIYLCNFLIRIKFVHSWQNIQPRIHECRARLVKKSKIKIKKKLKRIPVPQKPPKVEKNKKSYDRESEKKRTKKRIEEEISAKRNNNS